MSTVPTVSSIGEIEANLRYLDKLLNTPSNQANLDTFENDIVKRAVRYIKFESFTKKIAFAPSRFVGFKGYNMDMYRKKTENASRASDAVSAVLGYQPKPDSEMELEFNKWCDQFGFESNIKEKRFWDLTKQ